MTSALLRTFTPLGSRSTMRTAHQMSSRMRFVRYSSSLSQVRGDVVGIDLGTTNSCVAVMEGNDARVIENVEGARTTPSVVAFTADNQRLVGAAAKRQAVTNPLNTLFATKRLIGRRYDDKLVSSEAKMVPYKIVRGPNGDAWVEAAGKKYSPSEAASFILTKMKESAESFLGRPVTQAVVTVPAYFNDAQRQATKDAGAIAGLKIPRIINEPTAAALAYGLKRDENEGKMVAVFDLGGGTFDISILEISKGLFEVKSTNGDTFLGGEDFDNELVNHLLAEIKTKQKVDLTDDRAAIQRLRESAEKAKVELSSSASTEINIPYLAMAPSGPVHFTLNLTRKQFEQIVSKLLDRTIAPCKACLKDAKITASQIDEVILVGGMSRMPKVVEIAKSLFNKDPFKGVNPDEAVAVGAAIQGSILKGEMKDMVLVDVTPLSLGTSTVGDIFNVIIPRNSTIPTRQTKVFGTAEDRQTSVRFGVYQGEREMATDNKLLAEFELRDLPPMAKGAAKLEVTFEIDANGILKASARNAQTGKQQQISVQSSGGLSSAEIDRIINQAEANREGDKRRRDIAETSNEAEKIIYDTEKSMTTYKDNISKEHTAELKALIKKLQDLKSGGKELELLKSTISELQTLTTKAFSDAFGSGSGSSSKDDSSSSSSDDNSSDSTKKTN